MNKILNKIRYIYNHSNKFILAIFLLLLVLRIVNIHIYTRPIERWDEYTNLHVVEDTKKSPNWLILKYSEAPNGLFFEKPPIWYWTGIMFSFLPGDTLTDLRILGLLSGFGMIVVSMYITYKWSQSVNSGLITGIILILINHLFNINPHGIFSTHIIGSADLDFMQLVFLLLSIYFIFSKQSKKSFFLSGIFSGLAFMTKGPLGVLSIIVYVISIFIFTLYSRKKLLLKKLILNFLFWIVGFLIVVLPWHLYIYNLFGQAWINEYFGYHILDRALTPLEGHTGYPWMYIKYFFDPMINITGFVFGVCLMYLVVKKGVRVLTDLKFFVPLVSILLIFIAINLARTQIAWYLLPVYPFVGIFIGEILDKFYKYRTLD